MQHAAICIVEGIVNAWSHYLLDLRTGMKFREKKSERGRERERESRCVGTHWPCDCCEARERERLLSTPQSSIWWGGPEGSSIAFWKRIQLGSPETKIMKTLSWAHHLPLLSEPFGASPEPLSYPHDKAGADFVRLIEGGPRYFQCGFSTGTAVAFRLALMLLWARQDTEVCGLDSKPS